MTELEKAHLVGAFDLGKALNEVRPLLLASKAPYLLHVGSGISGDGRDRKRRSCSSASPKVHAMLASVLAGTGTALHAGSGRATGGYFTQVNPDEVINWR